MTFRKRFLRTLGHLATSKKAIAAVTTMITTALVTSGGVRAAALVTGASYILGQAMVDTAKVRARAARRRHRLHVRTDGAGGAPSAGIGARRPPGVDLTVTDEPAT